jgi:hypothetical protein
MIGLISITLLLFVPILSGLSLDNIGDLRLILIFGAGLLFIAGGPVSKDSGKRTTSSHNPLSYWVFVIIALVILVFIVSSTGTSTVAFMVSPLVVPAHTAYYRNLDQPRIVNQLRFRFRDKVVIYGFICRVNQMLYVGSTEDTVSRFYMHLVFGQASNAAFMEAIALHGLSKFTGFIFKVVVYPPNLTVDQRRVFLRKLEQSYMDMIPANRLFNSIKAKA